MMKPDTAIIVNQSTGYLTVDICNAFACKYDRVILLAGKTSTICRPLSDKVEVVKIAPYDKSGIISRFRTWLRGARDIDRFFESFDKEADILYFTNPPISYRKAAARKGRFAIVEYDIYPDVLKNLFFPGFLIRRLGKRKKAILSSAAGVITIGNAMARQLEAYCQPEKIKVIHNWSALEGTPDRVEGKDNVFARRLGLEGKFVVMYSGNIGITHSVETLIDVAEIMKNDSDVRFLIIGKGRRKDELMHEATRRGLENIVFHDFVESEQMKYTFSCASLGVVTLNEKTAASSVPSKTYNLLAYGLPLLNIAPPHSELGTLISEYNCGQSFLSSDIDDIADFIRHCNSDKTYFKTLSSNALRASENFTVSNSTLYTEIFK